MDNWQIEHIIEELKTHNCEIEIINPLFFDSIDKLNEEILVKLSSGKYNIFMTCHNEEIVYIDTLKCIKKLGVPSLLFTPDNLLFPYNHINVAQFYDLVWLTSHENINLFKKWGANCITMPYAANPNLFNPFLPNNEILKVAFIGQVHGSRPYRINNLTQSGVPVEIFTNLNNSSEKKLTKSEFERKIRLGFNYCRYPIGRKILQGLAKEKINKCILERNGNLYINDSVPFSQISDICSKFALMLSFSDASTTGVLKNPVPLINLRHFEIPMAGGLQFTTYCDELAEYFEDSKEIVMCRNEDEYIDKAKYYLRPENEKIRNKIKIAARKRAEAEHTWFCRFKIIFEKFGLCKF